MRYRPSGHRGLAGGAAALLAAAAFAISSHPVSASELPGLSVSGNHLAAGGHPFQLRGVNRAGTEYACVQGFGPFDGPSDDSSVAAIASWRSNAVRLGLNEDCWLGINGEPNSGYTAEAYRKAVIAYVRTLHRHGLYAILELHWSAPGSFKATWQEAMPDQDHSPAFWAQVAATFKDDPATIFDLFNEPVGVSWPCWRDGCAYLGDAIAKNGRGSWQVAGMQGLVSVVRNAHARNVILVGGLSHANDLSSWLEFAPADPTNQLAASVHIYDFNTCASLACWGSQVAPVAAQVPVVMGEIGQASCAADFIETLMQWSDASRTSYLAWVWDTWGGCKNVLITDYRGTPTAGYGQGFKAHLERLAAQDLAASPDRSPSSGAQIWPRVGVLGAALLLVLAVVLVIRVISRQPRSR